MSRRDAVLPQRCACARRCGLRMLKFAFIAQARIGRADGLMVTERVSGRQSLRRQAKACERDCPVRREPRRAVSNSREGAAPSVTSFFSNSNLGSARKKEQRRACCLSASLPGQSCATPKAAPLRDSLGDHQPAPAMRCPLTPAARARLRGYSLAARVLGNFLARAGSITAPTSGAMASPQSYSAWSTGRRDEPRGVSRYVEGEPRPPRL